MLSNTTRHYFIWALESASRLNTVPYRWNREKNRVEMKSSRLQIALWYLISTTEAIFELFVIFRVITMYMYDLGSMKDKISLSYTTIAYSIPVIFQIATWERWQLFPIFINSFMSVCQQFQMKHFPEIPLNHSVQNQSLNQELLNLANSLQNGVLMVTPTIVDPVQDTSENLMSTSGHQSHHAPKNAEKPKKHHKKNKPVKIRNGCDPYVKYIFIVGRILTSLQTVSIFRRPRQPYLLSSLWGVNDPFPWMYRLPIALFHCFMVWSLCFKMQLYIFSTLSYVSPAITILHELKLETQDKFGHKLTDTKKIQVVSPTSSSIKVDKVIPPLSFLYTYRGLQIQQNMFNNIFCTIELPFSKGALISVSVMCIYGAIRLDGLRAVVLGIAGCCSMVTLKIIYQSVADMRALSKEVLHSRRTESSSKWYQKMLRASKPMVTRIGFLYTVGKMIALFIYAIIMDRAITLLLAF